MLRLTRAQVREIDRLATEKYHIPGIVLMENAARSAAAVAMKMSEDHHSAAIVCGGGNNGGDGFAMARHMHNAGWSIDIVLAYEKDLTGDARINHDIALAMGLKMVPMENADLVVNSNVSNFVIDALFGTGLEGAPRMKQEILISIINESGLAVLSVDIPSGLDCDTGRPFGACVRAAKTVTFVAAKTGFANPASKFYTGEVIVGDIGCPRELISQVAGARDDG